MWSDVWLVSCRVWLVSCRVLRCGAVRYGVARQRDVEQFSAVDQLDFVLEYFQYVIKKHNLRYAARMRGALLVRVLLHFAAVLIVSCYSCEHLWPCVCQCLHYQLM